MPVCELTAKSLAEYLVARGFAADSSTLTIQELAGGVSNMVFLVEWPGSPERHWVVKQSLDRLRVRMDWRSDRQRVFREAEAIRCLRPILGEAAVPELIHVDSENFLFIMSRAPDGSVAWKEALLAGQVDLQVAQQAGQLLARLVQCSSKEPAFREKFQVRRVFDQLRLDPYYRTVAATHSDVAALIQALIAESWKIRTSLVHGDYSPKNMLVKGSHIFLIDFEVIHWGDPAFDSAFLLNHLFLKAIHRPEYSEQYLAAAKAFRKPLELGWTGPDFAGFERMTMRHLGALMLARIDGKSPVEYIRNEPEKDRARRLAKRILRQRPEKLGDVLALYRDE